MRVAFKLALARVYKVVPPVCAVDLPTKSHHMVNLEGVAAAIISLHFKVKRPNITILSAYALALV